MSDPIDTSNISFTGLYTGHVWYKNGLSAPCFRTDAGNMFYTALAPFEFVGKQIVGGNIRTFLLQRHHLIDHLLEQKIARHPDLQILEIACGLSPRGYRFCQKHRAIDYIEADLPAMAARKRALLTEHNLLSPRHHVLDCNIFATSGEQSIGALLDRFSKDKPVVVITEGLINYFTTDTISGFWKALASHLNAFPEASYLTDNYPLYREQSFYRTMKTLARMLGTVSRSSVSFHFNSDAETTWHFTKMGFDDVRVHNPQDFYAAVDAMPRSRGTPLVRIIEANLVAKANTPSAGTDATDTDTDAAAPRKATPRKQASKTKAKAKKAKTTATMSGTTSGTTSGTKKARE